MPERYQNSDVGQGSLYYHPETQVPMPNFLAQSPASHFGLPPLQNPGYPAERRGSVSNAHDDHNGITSRYADPQYTAAATQPSSPPLHHHGHLRERFVSRESHGSTSSSSVGPSPSEDPASWAYPPAPTISSSSYTLRPSFATTPATNTSYVPSPSYSLDHDGFTYSRSTPSSDRTSPSLTNSTPSSHEYSLPDERATIYDTTSAIRTRFEGDHDADVPSRVKLAPLHSLRNHPYRRDPVDDRALRKLRPRAP